MTLPVQERRNAYVGNGVQTEFPYNFRIDSTNDITILVDGVAAGSVTISNIGNEDGGNVTVTPAPPDLSSVVIYGSTQIDQPFSYQSFNDFPASAHEKNHDRGRMIDQELRGSVQRSVRLSDQDPRNPEDILLPPANGELLYLALDGEGKITGRQSLLPTTSSLTPEQVDTNTIDIASQRAALEATTASATQTWYVDPAGNDNNDGTTAGTPFRTLNKAISVVSSLIRRGITQEIRLSDGEHTLSSVPAVDISRPAVGYITGIFVGDRSSDTPGGLIGSLIIRGTSKAGTIVRTSSDFTYGLYASSIPGVAIERLTILGGVSGTNALLVAHRQTYVQAKDVILDGGGFAVQCAVAEAGGVMEIIGSSEIKGAATGALAFSGSTIVISNETVISDTSSSALSGRGTISVNNNVQVLSDSQFEGLTLLLRGINESSPVQVVGNLTAYNSCIHATYTEFSGALLNLFTCEFQLNASRWSGQAIIRGGSINLRNATKSFIDPATASTVGTPLFLLGNAQFYTNANAEINGSSGNTSPSRSPRVQTVTADAEELDYQAQGGRHVTTELGASGAPRIGCTLPVLSSDFMQSPTTSDMWTVVYTSVGGAESVELVDSTTARIVDGSIVLGLGTGQFQAINFIWSTAGRWVEISRSAAFV